MTTYHATRRLVSTPWGWAQPTPEQAPGVTFYSTASHGGFRLTGAALARVPERFQVGFCGWRGWFEEDCDWAIVARYLPELFTQAEQALAVVILRRYRPDVLASA